MLRARLQASIVILLALVICLSGCGSGGQGSNAVLTPTGSLLGAGTGTVRGQALDADTEEPLKGVTVSAGSLATVTDAQGAYTLTGLSPGIRIVTASMKDYHVENASVLVTADGVATADIDMVCSTSDWLAYDTTYHWQVEAVRANGSVVTGPVWSFTTGREQTGAVEPVRAVKGIAPDSAAAIARGLVARERGSDFSVASVDPILDRRGATLAYAFTLQPIGWVIVSGCRADMLPPVLAYSFDAPLDKEVVKTVRAGLQLRLAAMAGGAAFPAKTLEKNRTLWKRYEEDSSTKATRGAVYGPLLKAPEWHQFSPYNDLCPMDPSTDERSVVGCCATAYSQVFNHWQWPTLINAFTAADNYTTKTRQIKINATDANVGTLDYRNGEPDDATKAKLCFAVGVGTRMDYSSKVSTASTVGFARTLTNWDYYAPSIARYRINETVNTAPIITDIQAGRPVVVLLRKYVDGAYVKGHVVVVDGYNDEDRTFHVNYGWKNAAGRYWFTLIDDVPSNWTQVKDYIYDIRPKKTATAAPSKQAVPRAADPAAPYPEDGERGVAVDEILSWDPCDNAVTYNCYVWKATDPKPAIPCYQGLTRPEADSNYQPQ